MIRLTPTPTQKRIVDYGKSLAILKMWLENLNGPGFRDTIERIDRILYDDKNLLDIEVPNILNSLSHLDSEPIRSLRKLK